MKNARKVTAADVPKPSGAMLDLIQGVRVVEVPTTARRFALADTPPPVQSPPPNRPITRYSIEVLRSKAPSPYDIRGYWFEFPSGAVVQIGNPISATSCDDHQLFLRDVVNRLPTGSAYLSFLGWCEPLALSISQEMIISCTIHDVSLRDGLRQALSDGGFIMTPDEFWRRLMVASATAVGAYTYEWEWESYAYWENTYRIAIAAAFGYDLGYASCVVAPAPPLLLPEPEPEPDAEPEPEPEPEWEPVAEFYTHDPGDFPIPKDVGGIVAMSKVTYTAHSPSPRPESARATVCGMGGVNYATSQC